MDLTGINNLGVLYARFRQYDQDGNGCVNADEDAAAVQYDNDGDKCVAFWEMAQAVNDLATKKPFTRKEINALRTYTQMMPDVSPDNPIIILLAMEREFLCARDARLVGEKMNAIIARMKQENFNGLEPLGKLERVYRILTEEFKFKPRYCKVPYVEGVVANIFSLKVLSGHYECQTISLLLRAIGHEMNWPLKLVSLPNHQICRWEEPGKAINFDLVYEKEFKVVSFTVSDEEYKRRLELSKDVSPQTIYLNSLTPEEEIAMFYAHRASKRYSERIDYTYSGGGMLWNLRNYHWTSSEAVAAVLSDINKAIELLPNDPSFYYFRIQILLDIGQEHLLTNKTRLIQADRAKAKELDPLLGLRKVDRFVESIPECSSQRW